MNLGAVTVDFDSTVITREGKQEGAAVGNNPNRRGRNSHYPLMAFVAETRMVANAWPRPGNTAALSNCEVFMDETFSEALSGQEVGLVLADSGFYTKSILNTLESRELNYLVAVRCYPNIKGRIYGLKKWVEICDGIKVSETPINPLKKVPKHAGTLLCASSSSVAPKLRESFCLRIFPSIAIASTRQTWICLSYSCGTSTMAARTARTG
jgi:hypothetical protein